MGKPMIVRTYLQARKSKSLDRLVVATDDERIANVCKEAGAEVVMTSSECANGQPFASAVRASGIGFFMIGQTIWCTSLSSAGLWSTINL